VAAMFIFSVQKGSLYRLLSLDFIAFFFFFSAGGDKHTSRPCGERPILEWNCSMHVRST